MREPRATPPDGFPENTSTNADRSCDSQRLGFNRVQCDAGKLALQAVMVHTPEVGEVPAWLCQPCQESLRAFAGVTVTALPPPTPTAVVT